MKIELAGRRVLISISDPWEFVTENGPSRTGTIVGEASGSRETPVLRIQLDSKVSAAEVVAANVVATARHTGASRQELLSGLLVPFNFSCAIYEGGLSVGPIAFIGGLQLIL